MNEFLESTLFSNIIGCLSLVLSVVSIRLTRKTMKTAENIENIIKKEKVMILDKVRFKKEKDSYLKKLNTMRKAVANAQVLSYKICNDVLSIINDIKGFDSVISDKDMNTIRYEKNMLQEISFEIQEKSNQNSNLQKFDGIISTIISILCKGEYEL